VTASGVAPRLILADTSAWIACARFGDPLLEGLVAERCVLGHGVVTGELSLGCGATASRLAMTAAALPQAPDLDHATVRVVVEGNALACNGLSWPDASLIASALAACEAGTVLAIYTHDRVLAREARRLGVGWG
jgi:predicted nucleic acid-binding protein